METFGGIGEGVGSPSIESLQVSAFFVEIFWAVIDLTGKIMPEIKAIVNPPIEGEKTVGVNPNTQRNKD